MEGIERVYLQKKRTNRNFLIISVFLATYFIYTDFDIRQLFGFAALLALAALGCRPSFALTRTRGAFLALAAVSIIFFALPDARHDKDSISYLLTLVIMTVFVLFSDYDGRTVDASFSIIQLTGTAFMLMTLFFRVFPGVYDSVVLPHLSAATREEASIYMAKGYGIPLAGGYTYENLFFALTFAVSAGRLLAWSGRRALSWTAALSSMAGMLLTGRRSELLALMAVTVIILFIYRKRALTKRKLAVILLIPAGVVCAYLLLTVLGNIGALSRYVKTLQKLIENAGSGIEGIFGGDSDITSGRAELWSIAWDLFLTAPVLGIGFLRFGDHVPAAFSDVHGRGMVTNVHNDYLQHMCETGVIGTVMWLIPTLYLLWLAVSQARRIRDRRGVLPPHIVMLNAASLAVQLFFLILGLLDPCFYQMTYWCFYSFGIICLDFSLRLEMCLTFETEENTDADAAGSSECGN